MSTEVYKPQVTEFNNETQLYTFAESFVMDAMLESIGDEGTFRLGMSGGSTPLPLYKLLGDNHSLPWEDVELYQTDERFIDTENDESNQKHIKDSLGQDTLARARSAYFIPTQTTTEYAVTYYNEVIDSLDIPTFDLVILGIGSDGHFASLFPEGHYLGHQDEHVIATKAGKEYKTSQRVSLTIESILNSKAILVLLNGKEKANVLIEMITGEKPATEFPAKFLLAHPKLHIFTHIPNLESEESEVENNSES